MQIFFKNLLTILLALPLILSGCVKKQEFSNIKLPDWNPSEAVPLVNSSLSLKDVVDTKKVNVVEGADGMYTFIYRDTLVSPTAEEIIQIPDQSNQYSMALTPVDITSFPAGKTVSKNFTNSFSFNFNYNAKLKYVDIKSGTFALSLNSQFSHDVSVSLTFNSLVKNGQPLVRNYTLNYDGQLPMTINDVIDLSGYRVDLSKGGTTTNTFEYDIDFTVTSLGNPVLVTDNVTIKADLTSLKYSLMYGDIGQFPMDPYSGTIALDVFDRTVVGDLFFENPALKVTFDNSFGVPVSLTVNKLEAVTTDGQVLPITSPQFSQPIIISNPDNTQIGQSIQTTISLDRNNSNIRDALNPAPNKVNHSFSTTIGASGGQDNFITDKSQIKLYAEVDIPLDGRVHVYALVDTFNVNLPESQYVEKASLKMKTTNGLPLDVGLQGYFIDSVNNVIDSLIVPSEDIVVSGQIDNTGKVVSPTEKYTLINMDKQRYSKIAKAKKIVVKGDLVTTNNANTSVKIYSFYSLKIQLSLEADLKVKLQ